MSFTLKKKRFVNTENHSLLMKHWDKNELYSAVCLVFAAWASNICILKTPGAALFIKAHNTVLDTSVLFSILRFALPVAELQSPICPDGDHGGAVMRILKFKSESEKSLLKDHVKRGDRDPVWILKKQHRWSRSLQISTQITTQQFK